MATHVENSATMPVRGRRPGRGKSWLKHILFWFFVLTVVLPVGLILLFRFVPVPATPLMIGTAILDGPIARHWVPLEAISPNLVRAVIASEDDKFCSHYGFDFGAIDKALANNEAGRRLRGASTISQQTAKNLFLPADRTWARKGIEAYFTVLLEALWPKRRILETYLNIVEWGPRRFGAEAAAEADFRHSAARLSVLEAARLAAVLPDPKVYRADVPGPYIARQSGIIAARMGEVSRDRLDACIYR
jgi:monofunctional biosynthetic peptidoglycan transglycosylase